MSVLNGPGEGTWSAFAMKVAEERDAAREALANSDACWRMEQEFLQRKLAGYAAHIKSLEGLLVDAVRERDGAKAEAERMRDERDYWERRFEYADAHLSEAFNLSPMDNLSSGEAKRIVDLLRIERDEARAEIEALKCTRAYVPPGEERSLALSAIMISQAETEIRSLKAEVERLREEVESHRDAGGYAFRGGYIEDASGGRWWSAGLLSMKEAEIEMLRGVGCREAKLDEPESGPCGLCLKCAEKRGAKWALERHGNPFAAKTLAQYAEEICRDARSKQ